MTILVPYSKEYKSVKIPMPCVGLARFSLFTSMLPLKHYCQHHHHHHHKHDIHCPNLTHLCFGV